MTRTDIHRPSVLQPGQYSMVQYFDHGSPSEPPTMIDRKIREQVAANLDPATGRGTSQCHVCGAHIRYAIAWSYEPTGRYIVTGEECAETIEMSQAVKAHRMVTAMKTAAKGRRETARIATVIERGEAASPEQAEAGTYLRASAAEHDGCGCFICDVAGRYARYGTLSERQIDAVLRNKADAAERAVQPEPEPVVVEPVVEGTTVVEGTVVSVKAQEGAFGWTTKLLVQTAGNYRLWGTLPAALAEVEKGDRVRFTATVKAKEADFGFYSRPRAATIVAA